jgi:tol-pal system protein YbgF
MSLTTSMATRLVQRGLGWSVWLPLAAALGLLSGCESEPTQPDPVQVKVDDMDQRLTNVERVVNNQSLLQLSQRIDALDEQLRSLRGEVEQVQNSADTLGKQQRDFYAALDHRIAALESAAKGAAGSAGLAAGSGTPAGAGPTVAASTGGAATSANGNDQAAYDRAFNTLKSGSYSDSIAQFREFLQHYPQSPLDDNAQYWIGEAYYVMRDYDSAANAFRAVGEHYPQSRKAPDALLKLGMTQYDQQHTSDARTTLNQVVERYPNSDAAKIATTQLAKIAAESR